MGRGLCRDCRLRVNNACDEWGEDPTCKRWQPNDYTHNKPEIRQKESDGEYPIGTRWWERKG